MKLSDVINEMQEHINKNGDREISGINIINDKTNISVSRINKTLICNDGRYVCINFYELKQSL
jgi:hypothetical protein